MSGICGEQEDTPQRNWGIGGMALWALGENCRRSFCGMIRDYGTLLDVLKCIFVSCGGSGGVVAFNKRRTDPLLTWRCVCR